MTQKDPIEKVLDYHHEVSEFNIDLDAIGDLILNENFSYELSKMNDFFEKNIVEHFKYEETKIFPKCLQNIESPEIVTLVLELKDEHKTILNKVDEWQKLFSTLTVPPETDSLDRLKKISREIFNSLLAHAMKEDHDLIPFIQANREVFESSS